MKKTVSYLLLSSLLWLTACSGNYYTTGIPPSTTARQTAFAYLPTQDDRLQIVRVGDSVRYILANDAIFFDNSPEIRSSAYPLLNKLSRELALYLPTTIRIAAYTDNIPAATQQRILSAQRATSLKAYFWSRDLDPHCLTTATVGSTNPVADNRSFLGQRYNRRTEISLMTEKMSHC